MKIIACLLLLILPSILYCYKSHHQNSQLILKNAKDNPTNALYQSQLAELYMGQHQYEPAIPLLKKCIRLSPDNSGFYIDLAVCLDKTDQPDLARNVLTNITGDFNKNCRLTAELASLEYKLGDFNKSVAYYQKALKLLDKNETNYIYAGLAKSLRELKDFEKSKLYFRESLRLKPDCWTFYEYGKLFIETQECEQAVWAFERAMAFAFNQEQKAKDIIAEKLSQAYYLCGMKTKESGQKELAKKYFVKITENKGLQKTSSAEKASFWLKRL